MGAGNHAFVDAETFNHLIRLGVAHGRAPSTAFQIIPVSAQLDVVIGWRSPYFSPSENLKSKYRTLAFSSRKPALGFQ